MISRTHGTPSRRPAKARPSSPLVTEVRRRGLVGTLAAFAGSGWLLYEIVHWVLVDHYGLPDLLKDITIVTLLGALFSLLAWRWFRGGRRTGRTRWEYVFVSVLVLGTAALDVGVLTRRTDAERDPYSEALSEPGWTSSLAVLPFANLTGDREQDYFCDGMAEELISRLSRIRELKVTARTSAFALKGDRRDIREIGRALGVEKLLEGSVRKDASSVRIAVQLINAADGFHVWSETYDRSLENIFAVQEEIADSVARALEVAVVEGPGREGQTRNLEAFDAYLEGLHDYGAPNQVNLENAIGHFRKAVEIDPGYARGWASLAAALAFHGSLGFAPAETSRSSAMAAVERALELDEGLAYGHVVKGWIQMVFDWDWAGAEESFTAALRLEPSKGYYGASQLALASGRFERALALARKAAELDSLSLSAQTNLALAAFYAGRLDEAVDLFRRNIQLNPEQGNIRSLLAQVHLVQSRPELALEVLEDEREPAFRLPVLAMAFHALGRERDSDEVLAGFVKEYAEGGAYQVAQVHAFRGDHDRAFEWLEIAYGQRDGGLYLTKVDPYFRALRSDPRFEAFLEKLGFSAPP